MEIISIPLSGDLHHQDSTGRDKIIQQGDVQIMSAGTGIAHSEMNANKDKEVKFLQIWVFPKIKNITPRYDQKTFKPEDRVNQLTTVVAPDNADAVWINQDAWFTLGNLKQNFETTYQLHQTQNGVYAFVIKGDVTINGISINERDGLGITDIETLNIKVDNDAELLLMEIPMHL
jgi:hypothetical protein